MSNNLFFKLVLLALIIGAIAAGAIIGIQQIRKGDCIRWETRDALLGRQVCVERR